MPAEPCAISPTTAARPGYSATGSRLIPTATAIRGRCDRRDARDGELFEIQRLGNLSTDMTLPLRGGSMTWLGDCPQTARIWWRVWCRRHLESDQGKLRQRH